MKFSRLLVGIVLLHLINSSKLVKQRNKKLYDNLDKCAKKEDGSRSEFDIKKNKEHNHEWRRTAQVTNVNDVPRSVKRSTPGEFDDVEAIWIGWPDQELNPDFSLQKDVLNMVDGLCNAPRCNPKNRDGYYCSKIVLQVTDDTYEDCRRKLESVGLLHCVRFNRKFRNGPWMRDMGPYFSLYDNELVGIDFDFSYWSAEHMIDQTLMHVEESLDRRIYSDRLFTGFEKSMVKTIQTDLIGEGGNRNFNGAGILMMAIDVENVKNINRTIYGKNFSLEDVENEYKKVFGVKKIIWAKAAINLADHLPDDPMPGRNGRKAFGWGTGGHVDGDALFVSKNKVLVVVVSDEEVEDCPNPELARKDQIVAQYNWDMLANETDLEGNKFTLYKFPSSPSYFHEIKPDQPFYHVWKGVCAFEEQVKKGLPIEITFPTSYLNLVITNQAILYTKYYIPGDKQLGTSTIKRNDKLVHKILQEIYPKRKIVPVYTMGINLGGGGLHCISYQQPAVKGKNHESARQEHLARLLELESKRERKLKFQEKLDEKRDLNKQLIQIKQILYLLSFFLIIITFVGCLYNSIVNSNINKTQKHKYQSMRTSSSESEIDF